MLWFASSVLLLLHLSGFVLFVIIMKTATVFISAFVMLASVSSGNAFVVSPRSSLARATAVSPTNMVATEPEIVNGEVRPRRTREVCR